MSHELELHLHRLLDNLTGRSKNVREVRRAAWLYLREAHRFFAATHSCLAVLEVRPRSGGTGCESLQLRFEIPRGSSWDEDLLAASLAGRPTSMPDDTLLATVQRRGRPWGVMAVRQTGRVWEREERRALTRLCQTLSVVIGDIEATRAQRVRARIDRKIMEEIRPQDLFYQILHGLRSLTSYDHSAAVLMADPGLRELELVAEQVAWSKGKSRRIGHAFELDDASRAALHRGEVCGFDRVDGGWQCWRDRDGALAELVSWHGGEEPLEGSMLCAPLTTREGVLGLLKVASRFPRHLGRYEAGLVGRFLRHAAIAIRNAQTTQSLQDSFLRAERQHAMVNLARGMSHDVNNAIGSALPTVQQLLAEVREGEVEPAQMERDLQQVESALRTCRRIFSGMLTFARGEARGAPQGDLKQALHNALSVLRGGMERRGIELEIDAEGRLPAIGAAQHELEQLFLNLGSNARDAMPRGGRFSVTATAVDGVVDVELRDTGDGMTTDQLARVDEPFFTTKTQGHGLGLAICRSIISDMRGQMSLQSTPGVGTTVRLQLPAVEPEGNEVSS